MKTGKNILSLIAIAVIIVGMSFFGCARSAMAALVIEPALIEMELSQNRSSGAFIIKNVGDKEERYRAKAVHFLLTPEGGIKEVKPDEYSLADWVKFNPKEFVLPPKTSRVVRFSVMPQGKLRPKEYWGAIEFMPLSGAKVISQDSKGRSFNLEVLSVVLVPIYGHVDGTQYSGAIKDVRFKKDKEKLYVLCDVINTGSGVVRMNGSCQITDASGSVVDEIALKAVVAFAKSSRIVRAGLKKELAPGKYRARINLKSADPRSKMELTDEIEFTI